ncbi:MAG: hypothetical protein MI717_15715 [Spirochaetales bacterium]|nr:hypothetical protein [Spirochaetales bacterium]
MKQFFMIGLVFLALMGCKLPSSTLIFSEPQVFFVGNSITYVHDIPGKMHWLAQQKNAYSDGYFGYDQLTRGGATLKDYLTFQTNTNHVASTILTKKPKYIVLQEQSAGPFIHGTRGISQYYESLASAVGSELVFYQCWHGTEKSYRDMANQRELAMVPIGEIWEELNSLDSPPILIQDVVHQNNLGAGVNALAFYYFLFPDTTLKGNELSRLGFPDTAGKGYESVLYRHIREEKDTVLRGPKIHNMSSLDAVGNTCEDAYLIPPSPKSQEYSVNIEPWDVDVYRFAPLPPNHFYRITLDRTNSNGNFSRFFDGLSSYALFDEKGAALPSRISADKCSIEFSSPQRDVFFAIIGDGVSISYYDDFTMNITQVQSSSQS